MRTDVIAEHYLDDGIKVSMVIENDDRYCVFISCLEKNVNEEKYFDNVEDAKSFAREWVL